MKVNRFGMSQKIFTSMVKMWGASQLNRAAMLIRENDHAGAARVAREMKDVLQKTFINPEEDITIMLKILDEMISRESVVLA